MVMARNVHNLQEEILFIKAPVTSTLIFAGSNPNNISAQGSTRGEGENPLQSLTGRRRRRLPSLINNFRFFKLIQIPA